MNIQAAIYAPLLFFATAGLLVAATNSNLSSVRLKPKLSQAEREKVIEIAKECGIESVAEIRVVPVHPSSEFAISVKSEDRSSGRYVTNLYLNIDHAGWRPSTRPNKLVKQSGVFSIHGRLMTVTYGQFEARGETFRVKLESELTVEECDSIVSALSEGRFEIEPTVDPTKQALVRRLASPWKPQTLFRFRKRMALCASYSVGSGHSLIICFRLERGAVRIFDVWDLVS